MKYVKIKWMEKPNSTHISQIYSSGLEFAFATKTEQCTDFVFCKDFLHDCVYAKLHGKKINPYSFNYDPKKNPIDLDNAYLLVTNSSDPKMKEKIDNCQDFLNQIEKKLRLFRTRILKCRNAPVSYKKCGVYMFYGSKMWLNSPPMLSLYSLFIRVGFCHTKGEDFMQTIEKVRSGKKAPYQTSDASFLNNAKEGIDRILKLGYRKFFYKDIAKNYPADVDISTLHNYFGIVGFSQLFAKNALPSSSHMPKYWYRKSVKKLFEEKVKQEK